MLVFLDPRNRKFRLLLLLETSHLLNHTFLVAIDKAERFKKYQKKEKKVDKTLARNHKMLYNIIIKVKEKQVITSYEGRGKSPIKTKNILKILFSYPYLPIRLSPKRRNTMSSFIEAIKKSGADSLDVIMKNGRVYRYIGIDADHLGYLLEAYEEKVTLEESIGRFYNENIKGIYE